MLLLHVVTSSGKNKNKAVVLEDDFFCAGLFAHLLSTLLLVRGSVGSIPGSVKSDKMSPSARHRCDVSSELCYSCAKLRRWVPLLVTRFGVIPQVQL